MPRETIEFECNDCGKYFCVRLNLALEKDVLIQCPNAKCNRQHPRTIEKGELTGDAIERLYKDGVGRRAKRNLKEGKGEVIIGLACTLSDTSRLDKIKETNAKKGGFLAGSWLRRAVRELVGAADDDDDDVKG